MPRRTRQRTRTRHSTQNSVPRTAPGTKHPAPGATPSPPWQRNVYAVTAACFMGYTGFTLSMPFLPLYIRELGVTDVGEISIWTGVSLAITPALTALLAPAWGALGDRYGRKIMVERSLVSFVLIMAAMAEESIPPERNMPSGTSAIRRRRTDSRKSSVHSAM